MKRIACWMNVLVVCVWWSGADAEPFVERAQILVVGVVSSNPKSQIVQLEAMAGYLAERLGDVGIYGGAAIVARNNAEMARLLSDGAVDLFSETVFSGLYLEEAVGAEFLLREWKKGKFEYRTVIFARSDSSIRSIEGLRGKTIAFEDRGSTSAFLLPLAILKHHGFEASEISPREAFPADQVGFAFAKKEVNIAAWVARGISDAGAFSTGDWESADRMPVPLKTNLVIIHKSEPIMRSASLVRAGLRPELKARIKQILLEMHNDSVGRYVLKKYHLVARYDEITGDAARGLDRARLLYPLVAEEIQ